MLDDAFLLHNSGMDKQTKADFKFFKVLCYMKIAKDSHISDARFQFYHVMLDVYPDMHNKIDKIWGRKRYL